MLLIQDFIEKYDTVLQKLINNYLKEHELSYLDIIDYLPSTQKIDFLNYIDNRNIKPHELSKNLIDLECQELLKKNEKNIQSKFNYFAFPLIMDYYQYTFDSNFKHPDMIVNFIIYKIEEFIREEITNKNNENHFIEFIIISLYYLQENEYTLNDQFYYFLTGLLKDRYLTITLNTLYEPKLLTIYNTRGTLKKRVMQILNDNSPNYLYNLKKTGFDSKKSPNKELKELAEIHKEMYDTIMDNERIYPTYLEILDISFNREHLNLYLLNKPTWVN